MFDPNSAKYVFRQTVF